MFTRTRSGVAMRGVVDDPDLLRLNGHDPERLAALSWVLGSTLAVLAGILVTPISGGTLEANMLTLLVIDAFAAAMFGRLRSIPRTFVGALFLGLAATYVLAYFPTAVDVDVEPAGVPADDRAVRRAHRAAAGPSARQRSPEPGSATTCRRCARPSRGAVALVVIVYADPAADGRRRRSPR